MASKHKEKLTVVKVKGELVREDVSKEVEEVCLCKKLFNFQLLACPACGTTMDHGKTIIRGSTMVCPKCEKQVVIMSVEWRPHVTVEQIDGGHIVTN